MLPVRVEITVETRVEQLQFPGMNYELARPITLKAGVYIMEFDGGTDPVFTEASKWQRSIVVPKEPATIESQLRTRFLAYRRATLSRRFTEFTKSLLSLGILTMVGMVKFLPELLWHGPLSRIGVRSMTRSSGYKVASTANRAKAPDYAKPIEPESWLP